MEGHYRGLGTIIKTTAPIFIVATAVLKCFVIPRKSSSPFRINSTSPFEWVTATGFVVSSTVWLIPGQVCEELQIQPRNGRRRTPWKMKIKSHWKVSWWGKAPLGVSSQRSLGHPPSAELFLAAARATQAAGDRNRDKEGAEIVADSEGGRYLFWGDGRRWGSRCAAADLSRSESSAKRGSHFIVNDRVAKVWKKIEKRVWRSSSQTAAPMQLWRLRVDAGMQDVAFWSRCKINRQRKFHVAALRWVLCSTQSQSSIWE